MQFEPQEQHGSAINTDLREQQPTYDQYEYYGIPGARPHDDEKLHSAPMQRRTMPVQKRFPLFLVAILLLTTLALGGAFIQASRTNFFPGHSFPTHGFPPQQNSASHTFNVTGQNTLVVNDNSGSIHIQSGAAGSIAVQSSAGHNPFFNPNPQNNNSNPITYTQQGSTVSVSVQPGPQVFMQDTYLDITVPDGTALQINTDSGDVIVSNFNGQVNATANSGDVTFDHSQLQGQTKIQTMSGDISINGSFDPGGNYQLQTQSGDVKLQVPSDSSLRVSTSTNSGDVNNDFNQSTIGNGPHAPLSISTDSGDIDLSASNGD